MLDSHQNMKKIIFGIIIFSIIISVFPTNAEIIKNSSYYDIEISKSDKDEIELRQGYIYNPNSENKLLINNLSIKRYSYQGNNYSNYMSRIRNAQILKNKAENSKKEISHLTENIIDKTLDKSKYINFLVGKNVIYVPDDYPTIQSAVDNANNEDTIIVRDGTYLEDIVVDKKLKIQSENGYSNCKIQQKSENKHVINIISNNVEILGFKIVTNLDYNKAGISINNANFTTIAYNRFIDYDYGIKITNSNGNIIHDNNMGSFWGINYWSISLKNSNNNLINNNTLYDNLWSGLILKNSENNTITNNLIEDNNYGIIFDPASNNIISNNEFKRSFHADFLIISSNSFDPFSVKIKFSAILNLHILQSQFYIIFSYY